MIAGATSLGRTPKLSKQRRMVGPGLEASERLVHRDSARDAAIY
jgi:hypothetical protein